MKVGRQMQNKQYPGDVTEQKTASETASGCPFNSQRIANAQATSPTGCPMSARASEFDPFQGAYQIDPVEALRWSREQEPVFYAPKLGYWVVSRYQDVKAVFKDNQTFSPSIALEKITPGNTQTQQILDSYDYAIGRTLVNEDEPDHMQRRRVLMDAFSAQNLAEHEPMVQRLTRQCIDKFIDKGRADLIEEMFFDVTLTVAMHFLGVPEDDMSTLRKYSVAHTVNTWGCPTEEMQQSIAHSVGKFWKFSGEVLAKMKQDPSGPGWMQYSIRKQREYPKLIPDSYLHSMMMASIVAAHETSALASANAIKLLLTHRQSWEDICINPALIPNAVEECLRYSGSIIAWRRIATKDTVLAGTTIPVGAKLLIVMTSANHDGRVFENPHKLDIYRENTTDHLTFGYGSHQCLGKNLGRMEMRIFVEELSRRLPHMQLVADQQYSYLSNTSFRGPENLMVEWDPALNPEKHDREVLGKVRSFKIGAPQKKDIARTLSVVAKAVDGDDIVRLTLADDSAKRLPSWSPGSHVVLISGGYERMYSLCGDASNEYQYQLTILKEKNGRGGSRYFQNLQAGDRVEIRGPSNHFPLDSEATAYLLIAGGIGITPILAMADYLKAEGRDYKIHYAGKSLQTMACLRRLRAEHGGNLSVYSKQAGKRMDLPALLGNLAQGEQVYACGPTRLLEQLEHLTLNLADNTLHFEHFCSSSQLNPELETSFELELLDSGLSLTVAADKTLLQTLQEAGVDVANDCNEGLCGSCEVPVASGEIDHRDKVLSRTERRQNDRIMSCCSRSIKGQKLRLNI